MDDHNPAATTTGPHPAASGPVTAGEIAALMHRLARHRPPALGGDPAAHAALLAHKAQLLARIADQHAHTDPDRARQGAEHARVTARHAATPDTQDRTDVNDLTSPRPRGGEFR
jgi:hypothetical protein